MRWVDACKAGSPVLSSNQPLLISAPVLETSTYTSCVSATRRRNSIRMALYWKHHKWTSQNQISLAKEGPPSILHMVPEHRGPGLMAFGNPSVCLHYEKCTVLGGGIHSTVTPKYCTYGTLKTPRGAHVLGKGGCVKFSNLCFSIFQSYWKLLPQGCCLL